MRDNVQGENFETDKKRVVELTVHLFGSTNEG